MLEYSTRSHRGVQTRAGYRFGSMRTSSLAVRPSELVENNLSPSNFKHGLPETGNLRKNSNNNRACSLDSMSYSGYVLAQLGLTRIGDSTKKLCSPVLILLDSKEGSSRHLGDGPCFFYLPHIRVVFSRWLKPSLTTG